MTAANPFPESLLNIKKQTASAAQKAKALKAEADEAEHIHKLCEDATSFFERCWWLHLLDLIDKQDPLLKKMRADNHPAISSLDEIYQTAKEQARQIQTFLFPRYLEDACRAANLPLDRDSADPNYKFKEGFFTLHPTFRRCDRKKLYF